MVLIHLAGFFSERERNVAATWLEVCVQTGRDKGKGSQKAETELCVLDEVLDGLCLSRANIDQHHPW